VGNVIVNGGTFGIQATNMLAATSTVTVNNGAFHNLFSTIDVQHPVVVNDGGTFQCTSGTAVVNGNTTLNGADTNRFLGGAGTLNIAGKITGTGGFTKNGAGTMQLQNATNDYAGDTKITAGTLNFSATGMIPATTNLIVDGGTFATGNLPRSIASLSGLGGIISGGNVQTTTQAATTVWNGALNGTTAQMSGSGSLTLGGTVDNNSGIAIVNSGTLIFAKGNTATVNQTVHSVGGGGTASATVNGGILILSGTYNNTVAPLGTGVNLAPVGINPLTYVDQIYNGVGLTMTAGTFDLNGRQEAINGAAVAAGSIITNSAAGTTAKLFIGHQNAIATVAGAINDSGTGLMAIEKIGTNSLTLSGTSNFTGGLTQTLGTTIVPATAILGNTPIAIAAGTFTFDGTHGNGAIAVNGTSTFAGAGTSGGILTAAIGTTVRVGTASGGSVATTLRLGGLDLSGGANLELDFNPAGTAVDKIVTTVSNGLTLSGTNNLNVVPGSAGWKSGTYPIISYTGTVGGTGAAALSLTTPVGHSTVAITDDSAGNINLVVTGGGDNKWVGGNGDAWDIDTTLNWSLTGQKFLNGDTAVFTDTATTFAPVIVENVTPVSVIFDNTTAYLLGGNSAFGIIGTGVLLKKNTGTATMESIVNAYTGNTTVEAGTLIANFNTGTATTTIPAASLVQVDAGATLRVVANDANITFTSRLAGSGTIIVDPHLTAASAVREVNINSTGSTFTGTIRLSPTTDVASGLGTFRTNGQLTPAGAGMATIDVDAGGQAWINGGTFTNNFIISGHGFAEAAGGNPVPASGLTAYTDAVLKGGIGAIRMDANAVITGNVTLDGTAKIMAYGTTGTIAGSISTTNATDMLVIGGGGSGTNIFLTGTNNVGTNPLRDIFVNSGSTTAQGNLLIIGNNGTTGTLGTGAVRLNGDGGSGNVRFDRSDGYTLAAGNTITSEGSNTANTQLRLDSGGTGFNQNGVDINLGSGALQTGTVAGRLNSIANLNGNVTVGVIALGTGVAGSTLNILPGTSIVNSGNLFLGEQVNNSATANQSGGAATAGTHVRVGHWGTETSTYNISAGTLTVAANPGLVTNPSGTGEQNGGIYLGIDGTGILNQSGTSTVTTDWVVLDNRGDTGPGANMPDGIDRYNLSGGTLEIRGAFGITQRNATTEFRFTGGTIKNVGSGVDAVISGLGTFVLGTGGSGTPTFDTGGATNSITVLRGLTGAGGLIKTGAGTLNLTAINSYTGDTTVAAGTLAVSGASIADTNTLRINTGGVVAPTGTETVSALYFDGIPQALGTWGASGSGAANIDNVRFSGTLGVVNVVFVASPYTTWAAANGLVGGDADPAADPDKDGVANILEFATNSDPKNGGSGARAYSRMHSIAGENALTYTVAVRVGALFAPNGSRQEATKDGVKYRIEASNDLTSWSTVPVTELGAVDSAAVQAAITPALPVLDSGWEWRSFRTDAGAPTDPSDFIRLQVETSP
jgi:autotransporter-associated beta strand protein